MNNDMVNLIVRGIPVLINGFKIHIETDDMYLSQLILGYLEDEGFLDEQIDAMRGGA